MKILEQYSAEDRVFVPSSINEFVALQLAKRLQDEANLRLYLYQVDRHGIDVIFRLYAKAVLHAADGRTDHLRSLILNYSATP